MPRGPRRARRTARRGRPPCGIRSEQVDRHRVVRAEFVAAAVAVLVGSVGTAGARRLRAERRGRRGQLRRPAAHRAAESGTGILVSSSDVKELMTLCDRVLVLREGRVAVALDRRELSEARIVSESLGLSDEAVVESASER